MSFITEIRAAADREPNLLTQKLLRDAADNLCEALDLLNLSRDMSAMRHTNGVWARATALMDRTRRAGVLGTDRGF